MLSIRRLSITKFLLRNRFRREIVLVITLKLLALLCLWGFFFSHPVSKQLNKPTLVNHYLQRN
jgi:hypothetical protein